MKIISLIDNNNELQAADLIYKHQKSFEIDFLKRNTFCRYCSETIPWHELLHNLLFINDLIFLCNDHSKTALIWEGLKISKWNIVIFDAHNDYDSSFSTSKITNWNFINHIENNINNGFIIGYRHYHSKMKKNEKFQYITAYELIDYYNVKEKLINSLTGRPVYISIDLDVLDPSIFDEVDFPVPGGINYSQLLYFLDICIKVSSNVIIDISEFKPSDAHISCLKYYKKLLEDIDMLLQSKDEVLF